MPKGNNSSNYGYGSQGYTHTGSGTNSSGNHYCSRSGSEGQSGFHYSNTNGSYYYDNPDGSKYYNSGDGHSRYTSSNGQTNEKSK